MNSPRLQRISSFVRRRNSTAIILGMALVISSGFVACTDDSDPITPDPDPQTMSFKTGAKYEYSTYSTDPENGQPVSATERTRTWTLANASTSVNGRSNVAVYLDSVVATGVVDVVDTVYLQQESNNDIYRYSLLVPELDLSAVGVTQLDFAKDWQHEAKLGATSANWFVGSVADTFEYNTGIPQIQKFVISLSDSAVGSAVETLTIEGQSYESTKTTHKLELGLTALVEVDVPVIGTQIQPIRLKSVSLNRTTWIVPSLGAIAKEVRDGAVLEAEYQGQSIPPIPVPGYVSVMTHIIATGS